MYFHLPSTESENSIQHYQILSAPDTGRYNSTTNTLNVETLFC